jgi:hypothetical protein
MRLDALVEAYHHRMRGRRVRGQVVEAIELQIDTIGLPPRLMLNLVFVENPAVGSDEEKILQKVFSDIPTDARYSPEDMSELEAILSGRKELTDDDWLLSDETRATEQ